MIGQAFIDKWNQWKQRKEKDSQRLLEASIENFQKELTIEHERYRLLTNYCDSLKTILDILRQDLSVTRDELNIYHKAMAIKAGLIKENLLSPDKITPTIFRKMNFRTAKDLLERKDAQIGALHKLQEDEAAARAEGILPPNEPTK